MQEKELKTSLTQRIIIGIIAILLLSSTIAIYALIVLNGEKNKETSAAKKEELAAVTKELTVKQDELKVASDKLSKQYFNTLASYRNKVKAYNATSVDDAGLKVFDLKNGNGTEITDKTPYYAYYIGWCADESVFDSSFDNAKNPTSLKDPLAVTNPGSLIAGWSEGIKGMSEKSTSQVRSPTAMNARFAAPKILPLNLLFYRSTFPKNIKIFPRNTTKFTLNIKNYNLKFAASLLKTKRFSLC